MQSTEKNRLCNFSPCLFCGSEKLKLEKNASFTKGLKPILLSAVNSVMLEVMRLSISRFLIRYT